MEVFPPNDSTLRVMTVSGTPLQVCRLEIESGKDPATSTINLHSGVKFLRRHWHIRAMKSGTWIAGLVERWSDTRFGSWISNIVLECLLGKQVKFPRRLKPRGSESWEAFVLTAEFSKLQPFWDVVPCASAISEKMARVGVFYSLCLLIAGMFLFSHLTAL